MRLLAAPILLLLLLLSACGGPDGVPEQKIPVTAASMFFEHERPFCNAHLRDKFILGYYGSNLLDTTVHLYIISYKGDTVYHDTWESRLFLAETEPVQPDSLAHAEVLEGMRALLEGKKPFHSDSTQAPALPPRAFSYGVRGHGHVIAWSDSLMRVSTLH